MKMDGAADGPTVLIVESEEGLRRVIEESVEEAGFSVVAAATVREAATHLDGSRNFAAVVTDVHNLRRQQVSGWELARQAREMNSAVAVVYTGGAAGADGVIEWVPKSAFVEKPFAFAKLITALSANLNRSS